MPQTWGYQSSRLQDGGHSTQKENMLKKCPKQDFISITLLFIEAMIFKVVRNLFQTFHLDSLIRFRYRMIVSV